MNIEMEKCVVKKEALPFRRRKEKNVVYTKKQRKTMKFFQMLTS